MKTPEPCSLLHISKLGIVTNTINKTEDSWFTCVWKAV